MSELDDEKVRDLLTSMANEPEPPVEELAAIRAAARLAWREAIDGRRSRRPANPIWWLLAAASLAAAAVGFWWISRGPAERTVVASVAVIHEEASLGGGRALGPGELLREGDRIVTGQGPDSGLALSWGQGASLRLDSGTAAHLLSARRVELSRGALYVDSPGESPAGLEIVAGDVVVREIGTQFEVRRHVGGSAAVLVVRVRAGRVEIASASGVHPIAGGEEMTLGSDGELRAASIERSAPEWEWAQAVAPVLDLEGVALPVFLEWARREGGFSVAFAGDGLAERAEEIDLHGTVEGLTVREALEVVLSAAGLTYRLDDGVLVLGEADGG